MPNIDFKQFFSTDYIFEKTPPFHRSFLYIVAIFVLFILLAFGSWFLLGQKNKKLPLYQPLQKGLFNLFFYTGLMGLILSFFRWQQLAYLGSRFFMIVLFLAFFLFGLSILDYRFRMFPKLVKRYYERKNFEKYLPSRHQ